MRHDCAVAAKKSMAERAIRARITGQVRDVGLRDAAVGRAGELGVLGWVRLGETTTHSSTPRAGATMSRL